jgi:chemotaxis response regulator CheB
MQRPAGPFAASENEVSSMRAIPSSTPTTPKEAVSGLSCPECQGVLAVSVERNRRRLRFRCRIGHLYTLEEVIAGKEKYIEDRLWAAVTALSELETLLDELGPSRAKDIARAFADRAKLVATGEGGASRACRNAANGARSQRPSRASLMPRLPRPGRTRDIITIGASAGGVAAVRELLHRLPPDFDATLFVVIHRSPFHANHLASVLRGNTRHRVIEPRDRHRFARGAIYVAPRDRHLLLEEDRVRVLREPKEHFTRPAIDPLFRSAATTFGPRVVGVLLTGIGHDGFSGMIEIKAAGGLSLVQDPRDAQYDSMPRQVISGDSPDAILDIGGIAAALRRLMKK